MNSDTSQQYQFLGAQRNQQPLGLERTLSALETGGFGLSGLLLWLGTAPSMHAALGPQAMLVWLPGTIVGILLNLQVHRLGMHHQDVAGGTPNYTTRLLKNYPFLGCCGAIGYFVGWVSVPSINAIILTDLIKTDLQPFGIPCPNTLLWIGFTAIPFILAFSGIRALSILHLFFVLPAVGFLVVYCIQGLGWLALSPASPGFFPSSWSFSFREWGKWFLIAIYAVYDCETASSFVAESKRPRETLRFLKLAASLIPIVYLGGSWVLMRLATDSGLGDNAFLNLSAAARPFWGQWALVLVTFLIVSGVLLSSATAVSNTPRVLYQLAVDGYLSPVFAVLSRRGVLVPSLAFTLLLSLICLIWGDVSRILMVTGTSYTVAMMAIHVGLWLRRNQPEVLAPWWSLGFFLMEAVVLVVGGLAWGWQDLAVGLLLPIAIMVVDAAIRRLPFAPFHPSWWIERDRAVVYNPKKDFLATQVIVLLLLVCGAVIATWLFKEHLDGSKSDASRDLLVVLLIVIAFVSVAIACWTSLPQVAAIDEARLYAENLFITALDTVPDTILVVDENGVINQANPAAESLLCIINYNILGKTLNKFLPGLTGNPPDWLHHSEQTLLNHQNRIIEATISQRSQQFLQQYIVILRDITERKQAEAKLQQALQTQEQLAATHAAQSQKLELALHNLQQTQAQLIQTEKMSSLGQLIAGVAHEINNPISFIYGNLTHVQNYTQDLLALVKLYQQHYPLTHQEIQDLIKNIDLDFLIQDLPKTLSSMNVGAERICEIVLTLRNFSRLDEAEMKLVNIHQGIDSTLLILQHRLKQQPKGSEIEIIKEYGDLPAVGCYAGQLNQVFMNILSNAIDALQESFVIRHTLREAAHRASTSLVDDKGQRTKTLEDSLTQRLRQSPTEANPPVGQAHKGIIRIRTQVFNRDWVRICIKDNGSGISESVKQQLFDPFFTTKPVGKGTGLGLSISYQIVVDKHGGKLKCISQPGQGAEFWIEIPIQQSSTVHPSFK